MKTTNAFDYPTAAASSFKAYKEVHQPNNKGQKDHYKYVKKQQSYAERERVKLEQQKKQEQEKMQQQNRLREQILNKKRELQQLQRKRLQALQTQRKAAEFAKIKEEQDKITRYENQLKMKQYDQNANYRFRDALRRLQSEKQENSYKERQAMHRRKINQETQKGQRERAIKYKEYLQQKQQQDRLRALQQDKKHELLYKQGLSKFGVPKNLDFAKTCFHNPKMIYKYQQQQNQKTGKRYNISAFEKGVEQQRKLKQKSIQKRQRQQNNRQRSLQRGERAIQRISRQKQYANYSEQARRQQIKYNADRIQAGKKDQYIGLKPLTLSQMQANKKIRSQQQFEGMFIPSNQDYQNQSKYANKYVIFQNKFCNKEVQGKNFNKNTQQMNEESLQIYQPKRSQLKQLYNDIDDLQHHEIAELPQKHNFQRPSPKRNMIQTRATNINPNINYQSNPKEQLNYSQSQQEDSLN